MEAKLKPLLVLVMASRPVREARRALARRMKWLSDEERARQSADQMHEWLGASCHIFFDIEDGSDSVKVMTRHSVFGLAILYIEQLIKAWRKTRPPRAELDWLETILDLLAVIPAHKERPCTSIEDNLVTAFLVCAARWTEPSDEPLFTADGDVFKRSDRYAALASLSTRTEIVTRARQWCGQDEDVNEWTSE